MLDGKKRCREELAGLVLEPQNSDCELSRTVCRAPPMGTSNSHKVSEWRGLSSGRREAVRKCCTSLIWSENTGSRMACKVKI